MSKEEAADSEIFGDIGPWTLVQKPNVGTEDHLQSLGLDMSDTLPKFKFNEPGPTALATSIFQKNNMVNDETEQSFIVLSKASLETIRDTSLASYLDITKKSSLTDHNSLLSMMSPIEVQENLKKVLEENIKLKETLKKNNHDIKQQLNTITIWQKEVMTVCDSHKQKFLETKELIASLKKENKELQEKIMNSKSSETSMINTAANTPFESYNLTSLLKRSDYLSTENVAVGNVNSSTTACLHESVGKSNDQQQQLENNQESLKINTLSKELKKVQEDYSKSQKILQEYEQRYATDMELFSQQLQKSNKELETFKQKSDSSYLTEIQKLVNKCCEKDLEMQCLKEIIASLEQQITKLQENTLPVVNLNIETNDESSEHKSLLKENLDVYNANLEEFEKHFKSQTSSFLRIQEFLKDSAIIIQSFENSKVLPNNEMTEEDLKKYKEKLAINRKKLIDEQLKIINDKQISITLQKQLQKILSDFNSMIYEMELLKVENLKLTVLQGKAAEDNSLKLAEIEKYLNDEKKNLECEKVSLLEEKLNLQIEKKLISDERTKIEKERNSLSCEKENVLAEKISLLEEKTSLDRQSKLYETEEGTLQNEKKILQKKCDEMAIENERLKQELNKADLTIQQLQANNCKLQENEGLISAYRIQTEMHLKEFEEMRIAQKNLQDQLQSLSMTNLQLRTENDQLGGQQSQQSPAEQQRRYCGICSQYVNSEESHGYGICSPEFD